MKADPEETPRLDDPDLCGCGNPAAELHECPLYAEFADDPDRLCRCCPECTLICGMDR